MEHGNRYSIWHILNLIWFLVVISNGSHLYTSQRECPWKHYWIILIFGCLGSILGLSRSWEYEPLDYTHHWVILILGYSESILGILRFWANESLDYPHPWINIIPETNSFFFSKNIEIPVVDRPKANPAPVNGYEIWYSLVQAKR